MAKLPKIRNKRRYNEGGMFEIEHMDLEFSNGVEREYRRLVTHGVGAVIVVPITDAGKVLLVKEYAAGFHRYEVGLPKGRLEPGESFEEGANRELKEEVGFGANKLTCLKKVSLAPSYMSHETMIVIAQDLYPEKLEGDEPEELEVIEWAFDDIYALAERDNVSEGRTLAALYLVRDYLQSNG